METVRPVARHSPGDLCGLLCFLFHFWKFVDFMNQSNIRLKNAIRAEWGALLLGRNASFFKLMQDLPDCRSHTQIF